MEKTTYISWTRFDHRSILLSKQLDASVHFVYYGQQGKYLQAPWRYIVQGIKTWKILTQERPQIIFVQNPPIFCALLVFLYCKRYNSHYVIDSHTAAFLSPKWRFTLELHRFLSRKALVTIVHNESISNFVKPWGCNYFVLSEVLKGYPPGKKYPLDASFNIAVISAFAEDEPLDIVLDAANQLPDITFHVTGDSNGIEHSLLAKKPENLRLTGFLPYEQYIGLLQGVDLILDLTTRNHTILSGAFEAVSLGKPLITSDWPVLRKQFPIGTIHVNNSVEGLCNGVRQAQHDLPALQKDILILREKLILEWNERFTELCNLINANLNKQ